MEIAYDLGKSPVTYDFVNFLVNAERARRARGEKDISLNFVRGERSASVRDLAFSQERKEWRLQSLLAQLPALLPSITKTVIGGEGAQEFGYAQSSDYEPILKAPESALAAISEYIRFGKPYVTITLRDSDFQSPRNSSRAEWVKTAYALQGMGYQVVFVPDSEALMQGKVPDVAVHHLYTPAAMSQSLRLALYECAVLNCFTSGGPMQLGLWSSAPTFICSLHHESIKSCNAETLESVGLLERDIPEKFKWISWVSDTSPNVVEKLKSILPVCLKRTRPLILPKTFSVVSEDDRKKNAVSALARGYKCFQPVLPHGRTAILCCYGPSLKTTAYEIPEIEGDVFTVSGAHDFIAGLGIKITGHIESDPRPHKAALINNPQADRYYIAACCDPAVFDKLEGRNVSLWHPWNSEQTDAIVNEIDPTGFIVLGGTNVGLRAMSLLTGLGYRKLIIYGLDCSFDMGGAQHAGFHSGKVQRVIRVTLPDGAWYFSSPSMVQGCEDFFTLLPAFSGCEIDIKGAGLLQHRLRLSQQKAAA